MRDFLQYIQGNLQLEQNYTIPPLQEQDYAIMERILKKMDTNGTENDKHVQNLSPSHIYIGTDNPQKDSQ